MHPARLIASALLTITGAAALGAQGPGGPAGGGRAGPLVATADFLLANTGDLRLSDNQVVRLAGIARRSAERRRAMRDSLEDTRPTPRGFAGAGRDSAARAERLREMSRNAERTRASMERMREQTDADRRDAIAVLTPDQQAQAWELVATRGDGARFARGGGAPGFRPGGRQGGGPPGAGRPRRPGDGN